MAKSQTALRATLRENITQQLIELLSGTEEVLRTKSNQICFPCVDEEDGEWFARITIEIPTGSREDKEPFDAYSLAETYEIKLKENAEKAKEKEKLKKEKMARDAEMRAKKKEISQKKE